MKYITFFISIISLIMLASCDTCEEIDCPPPFTSEELQWLPYSQGDTLVFLETNSLDSLIYTITFKEIELLKPRRAQSPYCQTACYYHTSVPGFRKFSTGEEESVFWGLDKFFGGYRLLNLAGISSEFEFSLADAIRLDSLAVNGIYITDVYKYVCHPKQEKVATSYMHRGMGLVKIVFRNGQEYELVEHIHNNELIITK